MRILLTRTRIGAETPRYSYRVYVPFTELSLERQALISMHSDYGTGAGLLARLPDVIAPMSHLESARVRPFSDNETRALGIAFRTGVSIADLAAALDRKAMSLSKYATKHGYQFGRRPRRAVTLEGLLALE